MQVAIFQYLLPLLIVLFIYALIYKYLSEQQYPRHLRQSKTNKLLASISLTHCVIWLPFSIFNILADLVSLPLFFYKLFQKARPFLQPIVFFCRCKTFLLLSSVFIKKIGIDFRVQTFSERIRKQSSPSTASSTWSA